MASNNDEIGSDPGPEIFQPGGDEEFIPESAIDKYFPYPPELESEPEPITFDKERSVKEIDKDLEKDSVSEKEKDDNQTTTNRSILDQWTFSQNNLNSLIENFQAQQEHIKIRQKEIEQTVSAWKKGATKELEKHSKKLLEKQAMLDGVSDTNKDIEKNLKSKMDKYDEQKINLKLERSHVKQLQKELKVKTEENDKKMKKFKDKMNLIEKESKELEVQRAKFMNEQKDFALQVGEFEEKVKSDVGKGKDRGSANSNNELENEWAALHLEQEKLLRVHNEITQTKEDFKKKIFQQREAFHKEREELNKEWGRIKRVRKNLDAYKLELESNLRDVLEAELGPEMVNLRNELESQMRAELENKLREEMIDESGEPNKERLVPSDGNWSETHAKHERLALEQNETLLKMKGKFKNNFEKRIKKLKKLFRKNKRKKEELGLMEAKFKAEEEHRIKDLELEEKTRHDLESWSNELEQQRKQLDSKKSEIDKEREELVAEWKYISQEKKKIIVNKSQPEFPLPPLKAITRDKAEKVTDELKSSEKLSDDKSDTSDTELTDELTQLQTELKNELVELRSQHEELSKARTQFTKAKNAFEKSKLLKSKSLQTNTNIPKKN